MAAKIHTKNTDSFGAEPFKIVTTSASKSKGKPVTLKTKSQLHANSDPLLRRVLGRGEDAAVRRSCEERAILTDLQVVELQKRSNKILLKNVRIRKVNDIPGRSVQSQGF